MIVDNIHINATAPRVLVVPLDWGLGHATRCLPIIKLLSGHGVEVYVAGEGAIVKILEKTLPKPVILPLKGYRVKYGRTRTFFFLRMLQQSVKINSAIKQEQRWLKKTVKLYRIDAVISDNRFGLHHPGITSVFMTHQLFIETGIPVLNKIARRVNYKFIDQFNECWVPDIPGENNLAGKLSHPAKLPQVPVKYLGVLSRFIKTGARKKIDLLLLLSGPEPQRTIFENLLLSQLEDIKGNIVLVRGLPLGDKKIAIQKEGLIIHDHADAGTLNELILQAVQIVCRSGYSTIMDLVTLQQKAILVPTPGQTEQEYLAGYLMERKIFFSTPQQHFSLSRALESSRKFTCVSPQPVVNMAETVIRDWVEKLQAKLSLSR